MSPQTVYDESLSDFDERNERKDVATVLSVLPFPLNEQKPGVYPGTYRIGAVLRGDVETLIVRDARHFVYLDMDRGSLPAITPPGEIAHAIVADFLSAHIGVDDEAYPGLMWVFGAYTKDRAKKELAKEIGRITQAQIRWFTNLLRIGDTEWARNPNNHNVITNVMRYAAAYLGIDRPWNIDPVKLSMFLCPACKSNISADAVVCPVCTAIINQAEYQKFTFAKNSIAVTETPAQKVARLTGKPVPPTSIDT